MLLKTFPVFLLASSTAVLALAEDSSSTIGAAHLRGESSRHLEEVLPRRCRTTSDCAADRYCSTRGFCVDNGRCDVSADCDIIEGYPFGAIVINNTYCRNICPGSDCMTSCDEGMPCVTQEDCPDTQQYCSTGGTCLSNGSCNVTADCDIVEGYPFGEIVVNNTDCWNDCLSGECATACEAGKSCVKQEDCPDNQYCSTGGTCLANGSCNVTADCDIIDGYPQGEIGINDPFCGNECLSGECATACVGGGDGESCVEQVDCPDGKYCATGGICLDDGSCNVTADCDIIDGYPQGEIGINDPYCWNNCLSGGCATACADGGDAESCVEQADCPDGKYCATSGTCLDDGSCDVTADCDILDGYPFGINGIDNSECWNDCLSGECATACF